LDRIFAESSHGDSIWLYSMDIMTAEEVEDLFTDGSSEEQIMMQINGATTASPPVQLQP
jgi:hypothetical protein